MAEERRYNTKNTAVKRILQEVKEMQSDPKDQFMTLPLEENIFEWQFAILGPRDTEFEGGIYHGRIQMPADYPFKPPSFMMLTPSGRFEIQTKICLSISNYHPEHWQPSWSVRTALVALIAFMPTNPGGALGSLDYNKEVRRELAIKSREAPPRFGSQERQNLIDEIHQYMLSKSPPVPQLHIIPTSEIIDHKVDEEQVVNDNNNALAIAEDLSDQDSGQRHAAVDRVQVNAGMSQASLTAGVSSSRVQQEEERDVSWLSQRSASRVQNSRNDRLLGWAAYGLTIAILFLLVKKILKSNFLGIYIDEL